MTGRRLYDHYCNALRSNQRNHWDGQRYVRAYPIHAPLSWPTHQAEGSMTLRGRTVV